MRQIKENFREILGPPEELREGYELAAKATEAWKEGKLLDAISLFNEALKFFQEKKAFREIANVLESIGDIYHLQGKLKESLKAYKACLDICEEFEDEISTAVIAEKIVHVYRNLQEYEKMLPYLHRMLEIAEKFGDAHRAARAMAGIGDVYKFRKDFQTAREAYEIAHKIYEGMGARELAKVLKKALEELETLEK